MGKHLTMNLVSPPELQYITDALLARTRADGRALRQFRDIHLSTGVIAQSAGSARVSCAGTDVLAGIRLESVNASEDDERISVNLDVSQNALQYLPFDPTLTLTANVHSLTSTLAAHPQLTIIPGIKYWQLIIDITLLSAEGGGNLHDTVSIALKAALYDLRVPRTRQVTYVKPGSGTDKKAAAGDDRADLEGDVGMKALLQGRKAALDARGAKGGPADFELLEYEADSGEPLKDRDSLPVSVTLNLSPETYEPFLDAALFETFASPARLHVVCSGGASTAIFAIKQEIPEGSSTSTSPKSGTPGNEIPYAQLDGLLGVAEEVCAALHANLNERLKDPKTSQGGVRLGAFP